MAARTSASRVPSAVGAAAPGIVVAGGAALAAVVWAAAPALARAADRVLPTSATIRSAGSAFPALEDAFPFQIRATVLVAVLALVAALVSDGTRWMVLSPRASVLAAGVVVVVAAAVYGVLGYPHNGLPSNSRIHWVDFFFDRADNWFYALPRVLHRPFYDVPHVLQAMNGAVNVLLVVLVGRTVFRASLVPVAMGIAYLGSSTMLAFADTAEDVQLTMAVLLLAVLAYLRRWTPLLGAALLLVVLARPQLVVVWAAVVVTETVTTPRAGPGSLTTRARARLATGPFVWVNLAVALGAFLLWQGYLALDDRNWFLHGGRIVDTGLFELEPRPVDGYTISRLGGAYVLHALWIFPVAYLVAGATAVVVRGNLPLPARRLAVLASLVVVAGVATSEVYPLYYFNHRYLGYVLPFAMLAAFSLLALDRAWTRRFALALVVALTGSAATPYWQHLVTRDRLDALAVVRGFDDRHDLRDLARGRRVATTFELVGERNYLAYLLQRPIADIEPVEPAGDAPRGFLVFGRSGSVPEGEVVLRDGDLVVVDVPAG